jgi:hypothetical protein
MSYARVIEFITIHPSKTMKLTVYLSLECFPKVKTFKANFGAGNTYSRTGVPEIFERMEPSSAAASGQDAIVC